MKYIRFIYGYPAFVVGKLIADYVLFFFFGWSYFEMASGISDIVIISVLIGLVQYVLGVIFLLVINFLNKKIDFTNPISHLLIWAFISGIVADLIPGIIDNIAPGVTALLSILFFSIWLPVLLTSIVYFVIKK